ncbi:MAG TPA: hypothetical protein VH186_07700 [Chloroflexia bacterium]|nr:hypothetical protein [Chloroflexia bacterium]
MRDEALLEAGALPLGLLFIYGAVLTVATAIAEVADNAVAGFEGFQALLAPLNGTVDVSFCHLSFPYSKFSNYLLISSIL